MKTRTLWLIGAASIAAIAIGATFTMLPASTGRNAPTDPQAVAPIASASGSASIEQAPTGTGSTAAPSASSPAGGTGSNSTGSNAAGPTAGRTTTEVIPSVAPGSTRLPGATTAPKPSTKPTEPLALISKPLPTTATAQGSLVAGFPTKVIALPSGTKIAMSAVSAEKERLQVTVTGTTTMSVTKLLAFYRDAFAKFGLVGSNSPALGGSTAKTYTLAGNTATVTATPASRSTEFVLFAVLSAGS